MCLTSIINEILLFDQHHQQDYVGRPASLMRSCWLTSITSKTMLVDQHHQWDLAGWQASPCCLTSITSKTMLVHQLNQHQTSIDQHGVLGYLNVFIASYDVTTLCCHGAKCRWRAGSDRKHYNKLKMPMICVVYGCSNRSNHVEFLWSSKSCCS